MPGFFRKYYHELIRLNTFKDRYEYLRLGGFVGKETFGFSRYLNQVLYTSPEWRSFRREIIIRDGGRDLAFEGRDILAGRILIHHLNPLTLSDVEQRSDSIFDPDNVVCVSHKVHQAIHYGDASLLPEEPTIRQHGDTCPWA